MESVFDHFKCRGKDLLYTNPAVPVEYNNNKLLGIKVLGRAAKVAKEEGIMCVGGLGRLDGVWNGDMDEDEEVFGEELREWGNWDPDFGKVLGRLGSVQEHQGQGQMVGGVMAVGGGSNGGQKGKDKKSGSWYVVKDDEDDDLDI